MVEKITNSIDHARAALERLMATPHSSTYDYLQPTDAQMARMATLRAAAKAYSDVLVAMLPPGPDTDHVLRLHRTTAMWANVAITRLADGTPRTE